MTPTARAAERRCETMNQHLEHFAGICLTTLVLVAAPAAAQWDDVDPDAINEEYRQMQIVEHLDATLPLELTFTDAGGEQLALGELFDGKRPVVLALIYHRCPMLCGLVTRGLLDAAKSLSWTPGEQYRIVVVSFDHTEGPKLSDLNRRAFLADLNRPGAEHGVTFLTGSRENIRRVTDTVGFPFKWSDEADQYSHPSAIFVLTPAGRISRYLYGVNYEEKNLRLSLVEASDGKVGSFADKITLLCSHYDASTRGYVASAIKIMNLSALTLGVMILAVVFAVIIFRRASQRKADADANATSGPGPSAVNA